MKENKPSGEKINPTAKTIKKVLDYIKNLKKIPTITSIQKGTGVSHDSVKESVNFLNEMGIVSKLISGGGTTFVQYIGGENAI